MPIFGLNWSYSGSSNRSFTTPLYFVLNSFMTAICEDGLDPREIECSLISEREDCFPSHSFWRIRSH